MSVCELKRVCLYNCVKFICKIVKFLTVFLLNKYMRRKTFAGCLNKKDLTHWMLYRDDDWLYYCSLPLPRHLQLLSRKSKYYSGSKAGREHSPIRKITVGGERKRERVWRGWLTKRQLKRADANACNFYSLGYCCVSAAHYCIKYSTRWFSFSQLRDAP